MATTGTRRGALPTRRADETAARLRRKREALKRAREALKRAGSGREDRPAEDQPAPDPREASPAILAADAVDAAERPVTEFTIEPTDAVTFRREENGPLVAVAPSQAVVAARAAWQRVIPPDSPDLAPERRITRDELITRLRAEGLSVSPFDLGNWQADGVVPFGISRWDGRVTRSFYPPIMVDIVRTLRALQANGHTLADIGPMLRRHFADVLGRRPDAVGPPEFADLLAAVARDHERVFGNRITRAEVRLIDEHGIPTVYRFDVSPDPNK